MEMMDGQVYLHLNLGSGSRKVKVTIRRVDDSRWHEISYNRDGRAGVVSVDELVLDFAMQGMNGKTQKLYQSLFRNFNLFLTLIKVDLLCLFISNKIKTHHTFDIFIYYSNYVVSFI